MAVDTAIRDGTGKRTLVQTLLRRARVDPDRTYGSYPLSNNISDGFRDFTVGELSRAVDVCAWRIKERYGLSADFETLLYVGASDFRYTIVMFAAVKCGYKACFQNPKNPQSDNFAILDKTECVKAMHSCEMEPLMREYQSSRRQLQSFELPSLADFFDGQLSSPPFPYESKTWEESKYDPIVVLHSSGTTGSPKPIVIRNGITMPFDKDRAGGYRSTTHFDHPDGAFMYVPFPAFYVSGFWFLAAVPVLSTYCAAVVPPPDSSPGKDGQLAIDMIRTKGVKLLMAAPLLLEEMAKSETGFETIQSLTMVAHGGAPLRPALGDILRSRGVPMCNLYGSTEAGWISALIPKTTDWEWLQFPPDLEIDWQDCGEGLFELCFSDHGLAQNELRGTHWTLRDDNWQSKYLFVRHPQQPHLWKYFGRRDDMLLLGHAHKVNPIPVEHVVTSDPHVSGALLAGEGRSLPCMLIEPRGECGDVEALRQKLWPCVESANGLLREDNRISPSHVGIVAPGSFVRTPKASMARKGTVEKHADTIEELYVTK